MEKAFCVLCGSYLEKGMKQEITSEMVERTAREEYIENGFKFYGEDGEPTSCISRKDSEGRWHSEISGDCGELNRKAAAELWDTGKYNIDDFGGDDFHFKLEEKVKDEWRAKARRMLGIVLKTDEKVKV